MGNIAFAILHPENALKILEDKIDSAKIEKYRIQLKQIETQIKKSEKDVEKILDLYLDGKFDNTVLSKKHSSSLGSIARLKEEKMTLESKLSGVKNIEIRIAGIKKSQKEISKLSAHFMDSIHLMSPKEKQELLSQIFDKRGIVVHPMTDEKAKELGFQILEGQGESKWPGKNYLLEGEGNFDFSRLASSFKFLKNYLIGRSGRV